MKKGIIKKVLAIILMCFLQIGICFAGQLGQNEKGFYYIQDDGTLAVSKWVEADFVGEGKNSNYYFDENGIMLVNTTTPDGYFVGVDGKWDENQKDKKEENDSTLNSNKNSKSFTSNTQKKNTQVKPSVTDEGNESSSMVWLSATGSKYHSINNCGNMNPKKARQVTENEAKSRGMEKCSKCW